MNVCRMQGNTSSSQDLSKRNAMCAGARYAFMVVMACLTLPILNGCGKRNHGEGKSGPMRIENCGSDTMVNLTQRWAEEYKKVEPGVSVDVSGGGSGVGIQNLTQGRLDIANCSRDLTDSERRQAKANTGKEPVEWVVGYDALAVYVHKDNPIEELTIEQLAAIYAEGGRADKWSDIGIKLGAGVSDEIVRVSRQNSSGTYIFFREHVLAKKDFKRGSRDMSGSKDVVDLVGKTLGAIGYSGMGYKTDAVKFVKIAKQKGDTAYEPTLANVAAGHYSLARSLLMFTLGQPEGHVKKYVDWVLGEAGQQIVEKEGYIPVSAAGSGKP